MPITELLDNINLTQPQLIVYALIAFMFIFMFGMAALIWYFDRANLQASKPKPVTEWVLTFMAASKRGKADKKSFKIEGLEEDAKNRAYELAEKIRKSVESKGVAKCMIRIEPKEEYDRRKAKLSMPKQVVGK